MADFSRFDVIDATYKVVDGHNVDLTVLIVKGTKPGRYPLMVRFHGGFLVTGSRMYAEWYPNWLAEYQIKTPSITITADYQLLPEARGADLLSDISDLWKWVGTKLSSALPAGIEADLTRIMVIGDSAGGYMAVQSALLHEEMDVKAVICQYGMVDPKSKFFTEAYEKLIFGAPMVPRAIIDDHVESIKQGKVSRVVSAPDPPARLELALSMIQQGRLVEFLGEDTELFPLENLERAKHLPALWLLHGTEDTAVPFEGTQRFIDTIKRIHPNAALFTTIQAGDHGFDTYEKLETPFLQRGIAFIEKHWLGRTVASV